MVNIQSKEVLARLLATENLTVVHENVQTASFNVEDRILTLPLWDGMENYTYDHLVGHEVAHALYTPADEWMEKAKEGGQGFQSFLNVVEDARIEKMIQRRYPGLRKSFIQSYKKLLADGFFGKDKETVNSFKLIDRLNVFFKCGHSAGVVFDAEEKAWVTEIENAETFDEVFDIATRLYGKAKEEQELEQEQMIALAEEFGDEDGDEDGDDSFSQEEGKEETTDEEEKTPTGSSEDDLDGSEEQIEQQSSGKQGGETGPESYTDKALKQNINNEFSSDADKLYYNLKLPVDNHKITTDRVVDYKEILSLFDGDHQKCIEIGEELLDVFMRDNKKTINYLVKEFEMKKKAAEYKRASTSKTGVIDTLKMNNYKFSEDIFKKVTVLPEGKDHGLLMFVDWSGSMANQLKNTVDQLLNLVMFCKQVNIPFEVYAFSDRYVNFKNHKNFKTDEIFGLDDICYQSEFRLLQFFTNKMSRSDFQKMAKAMLSISNFFENYRQMRHGFYRTPSPLYLGGTPLNEAIVSSIVLYKEFKNKNRLDVVNTVFLTDGSSNNIKFVATNKDWDGSEYIHHNNLNFKNYVASDKTICYINDPVSKKRFRFNNDELATPQLLRIFREVTSSNAIGFHILPARKPSAISEIPSGDYYQREQLWENLKKDKFCLIPDYGYSAYFGILGGRYLATSNGAIEVAEDASKAMIRQAFKKANGSRKGSRIMLSKFIDYVA